ncbi:MAG: plasmid pRiA4b ORF-3 family protein [Treponema sp.]|jgi:hypothetical protein|nr:plasmid pRiA4b ORF-3 family protein [Treponema sp.]
MTESQEEALYDFLDMVATPFSAEDAVAHIRRYASRAGRRLVAEVVALIESRNIAFRVDARKWVSRRGCFEQARFAISPTREELLNGVLIPGHRCVPFANPSLLPQEYEFFWDDRHIPYTTSEGAPEEFYPYYSAFGEEYAPQYVARDNPENEAAFNDDPYDDPPEVSIQVLDMRHIYRESGFVPGDRFLARTLDWKKGVFALQRVTKDEWTEHDLDAWRVAAEAGFEASFKALGPGVSTEEQIAFAYWHGGVRMRSTPAYSLEEFLYDKTERIETVGYGIESRFWYAGKEIPDRKEPEQTQLLPDHTRIEELLFQKRIPITEYVVMSYVRDGLFRGDTAVEAIAERVAPMVCGLTEREWSFLAGYIIEVFEEFKFSYNPFVDKKMGPIRQRVGELHTAVIDLTARLRKGGIDESWLPRHTFIILSQIQEHAAAVLEDLNTEEAASDDDLESIDTSLDSMIETYEDVRELIDEAMDNFRQQNFSLVRNIDSASGEGRLIQISIVGTDVWRRLALSGSRTLLEIHRIIQALFGWKGAYSFRFTAGRDKGRDKSLDETLRLCDLGGSIEVSYEYGPKWEVKIIILSSSKLDESASVRCIAGAGAPPPETLDGPIRFRRSLGVLESGGLVEKRKAEKELGEQFDAAAFDIIMCNKMLSNLETL